MRVRARTAIDHIPRPAGHRCASTRGVALGFVVDADPFFAALVAGVDPPDVVELLAGRRPAWHANAACRGMGTELFFPEKGEDARPAKAICSTCPVAAPCGAATGDHGIWGGMSPRERMRGRRAA